MKPLIFLVWLSRYHRDVWSSCRQCFTLIHSRHWFAAFLVDYLCCSCVCVCVCVCRCCFAVVRASWVAPHHNWCLSDIQWRRLFRLLCKSLVDNSSATFCRPAVLFEYLPSRSNTVHGLERDLPNPSRLVESDEPSLMTDVQALVLPRYCGFSTSQLCGHSASHGTWSISCISSFSVSSTASVRIIIGHQEQLVSDHWTPQTFGTFAFMPPIFGTTSIWQIASKEVQQHPA